MSRDNRHWLPDVNMIAVKPCKDLCGIAFLRMSVVNGLTAS